MQLKLYQIDAFADRLFQGNPAAVCPLEAWLSDSLMQSIAAENNLSETAFFVREGDSYHIRWFTPVSEVDLCGHATLASACVIFNELGYQEKQITFESRSGVLTVQLNNEWLQMDFPAQSPVSCAIPEPVLQAFKEKPVKCLRADDYILVFDNEDSVLNAKPNIAMLSAIDLRCVVITARSDSYDFVSRVFAPKYGIDEDPVTGSVFTELIPYWSSVLNKNELHAKQVSSRGGEVLGVYAGDRVSISGKAVKYMEADIKI